MKTRNELGSRKKNKKYIIKCKEKKVKKSFPI
jgi:hypothetical protein